MNYLSHGSFRTPVLFLVYTPLMQEQFVFREYLSEKRCAVTHKGNKN